MHERLQPHAYYSPKYWRLQPNALEAAAQCLGGCSITHHHTTSTRQGILGDCWFLSAVAVLARKLAGDATADGTADATGSQARLQRLFAYCAVRSAPRGRYTLQFWKRGAWRRVTIDDWLPCVDGALLYP